MERLFGKVDYRLHKLKQLKVVSRSLILQQTEQHRKDHSKNLEVILRAKRKYNNDQRKRKITSASSNRTNSTQKLSSKS